MIISHSKKFVYIRSQKTGSTSIQEALTHYCDSNDYLYNTERGLKKYNNLNKSINIVKCDHKCDHASIQYVIDNFPETIDYIFITSIRNPYRLEESRYFYKKETMPFSKYLKETLSNKKYDQNKYCFIEDESKSIDFFIKFENMEEDWKNLLDKMSWHKTDLPLLNKTEKKQKVTWDKNDIHLIEEKYGDIINKFNYKL